MSAVSLSPRAHREAEAALAALASWPFLSPRREAGVVDDPGRRRLLLLQDEVRRQLGEAGPAPVLPRLRTEAYRLASCSWEDRWAYGMVAWTEEATAEVARRSLVEAPPVDERWREAWSAWRTAWWIRRAQKAPALDLAHGDLVMGILHARVGRWADAKKRLSEGLEVLGGSVPGGTRELWQAVASVDGW